MFGVDAMGALENLLSAVGQFQNLFFRIVQIMGAVLVVVGLGKLAKTPTGQNHMGHNPSVNVTGTWEIIIGSVAMSLVALAQVGTFTIFGVNLAKTDWTYNGPPADSNTGVGAQLMYAAIFIIFIYGWFAIAKALFSDFRRASYANEPGNISTGMKRLVAGILMINAFLFVDVIGRTIGYDEDALPSNFYGGTVDWDDSPNSMWNLLEGLEVDSDAVNNPI